MAHKHGHGHHVFSVEKAKHLIRPLRMLTQNPGRILRPVVREGMTVLDMGCGPGYFTIPAAGFVGEKGKVIAVDLQQGMLDLLAERIRQSPVKGAVTLHKCEEDRIGVTENIDLFFAFHVVHEVPDQDKFFAEIQSIIKPNGMLYISEPKHRVEKEDFEASLERALKFGFIVTARPYVYGDMTAVLSTAGN